MAEKSKSTRTKLSISVETKQDRWGNASGWNHDIGSCGTIRGRGEHHKEMKKPIFRTNFSRAAQNYDEDKLEARMH
jgi:hypothetical protein